ncbi:uncharacterized protein LOC143878224 [Tasmannia lanceolata]|uniref:uncharacterized protein LOC143878224 n=1 Tax=Tasmannia lanceolata TaxID=3420 RepID=UPI00406376CF
MDFKTNEMGLLSSPAQSSTEQIPLSTLENTNTQSNPPQNTQQGDAVDDAVDDAIDAPEPKPDLPNMIQDSDAEYYKEKYKRYEAEYVHRIKAKYFSKKAFNGGNIFDKETTIEDEVIKSSRWPCTKSFTDPVQYLEDQSRTSAPTAETSSNTPNKKNQSKKSS